MISTSVTIQIEQLAGSMVTLKSRLLTIAGIAIGILAVRRLRNRLSKTASAEPIEIDHENPETAAEHATVAAEHARLAAEKVVKNRGEK